MRFAVLFASLASASAAIMARQSLPNCAAPCLANAATGSCSPTDDTCLCRNEAFINSTATCIESSCTGSDLQNAEAYAQQLCLAVEVTLTLSSVAPASTASANSTASPSGSSSSGTLRTGGVSIFAGAAAVLVIASAAVF